MDDAAKRAKLYGWDDADLAAERIIRDESLWCGDTARNWGMVRERIADAIREGAPAQPALAWTREPPTQSGAYWMRCDERETQVVMVYPMGGRRYVDSGGRYAVHVDAAAQFWCNLEWYGPLPEPPAPVDSGKDADSYKHLPPRGNA